MRRPRLFAAILVAAFDVGLAVAPGIAKAGEASAAAPLTCPDGSLRQPIDGSGRAPSGSASPSPGLPGRAPKPALGVGLAAIADWSTQQPFLDVMKTARPWHGRPRDGGEGWNHDRLAAAGHLDADGWPLSLPATVAALETYILTDMPAEAVSLAGRYRLTYEGAGRVLLLGAATDPMSGPGEIRFTFNPGGEPVRIVVERAPVRAIRVVREEDAARLDAGEVFNPRWLDRLRGMRSIRFMDWMATNDSPLAHWGDRPKPSDYTYARIGAPVEVMVALANALGADPWFTLPHRADDAFVRAFATYVRDHLDPALVTYAEYSNETWNFGFGQTHWLRAEAERRWGAKAGGDAWIQYAGVRAAEVAAVWAEVYGPDGRDRLTRVVATQTGWMGLEQPLLTAPLFVAEDPARNRPPSAAFDAYAVTGYFGHDLGSAEKAPLVRAWLQESRAAAEAAADALGLTGEARARHLARHRFDRATTRAAAELRDGALSGSADGSLADLLCTLLPYHAAVAKRHGLDLVLYEGGTHVVGSAELVADMQLTEFFIHLNYSPDLGALYRLLLGGWAETGGTLFTAYVDVARPSRWGSWGHLRHLDDDTPRWDALQAYRRVAPPS